MRKKIGRPKKRTPEYLQAVLEAFQEAQAWFARERGCTPSSDIELLTAYFAGQFAAAGERSGRAASPEFKRALKTFRNELAEARRLECASRETTYFRDELKR